MYNKIIYIFTTVSRILDAVYDDVCARDSLAETAAAHKFEFTRLLIARVQILSSLFCRRTGRKKKYKKKNGKTVRKFNRLERVSVKKKKYKTQNKKTTCLPKRVGVKLNRFAPPRRQQSAAVVVIV